MNLPKTGKGAKMSERSDKIGRRYNELRAQGIPGKEAAERVNKEFGEKLKGGTIRHYGHRYRNKSPEGMTWAQLRKMDFPESGRFDELRAQGVPPDKAREQVNTEFGHNKKKSKKAGLSSQDDEGSQLQQPNQPRRTRKRGEGQPGKTPDKLIPVNEFDQHIQALAREVFQEMLHNIPNGKNVIEDIQDMPPEPETLKQAGKGRRENREYEKISLTVDKVLWDLFSKERKQLNVSSGRLLDIILWRHFGRPTLSFEQNSTGV